MNEVVSVLYYVVIDDELPMEFEWVIHSIVTAFE